MPGEPTCIFEELPQALALRLIRHPKIPGQLQSKGVLPQQISAKGMNRGLNAMRDWGTDYLHEQNLEPNCSMTGEVCCCEKNRS